MECEYECIITRRQMPTDSKDKMYKAWIFTLASGFLHASLQSLGMSLSHREALLNRSRIASSESRSMAKFYTA